MVLKVDAIEENADWPKARRWNLPAYKSEVFMGYLNDLGWDLDRFRRTVSYRAAVERGEIVDDEWVGEADADTEA